MALPSERSGLARPGLLTRFWRSLTGPPAAPPPPPPLFRARPLPPPEPRGPGLPDWDEILREAPPPPEPRLAPPDPVPVVEPVARAPEPAVPAVPLLPPSQWPAAVRAAIARVRALIWDRNAAAAQAVLDDALQARAEVVDRTGLPVYLLESYRCAVLQNDAAAATGLAAQLRGALPDDTPVLETLVARGAIATGAQHLARAAWLSTLHRTPGHPEAVAWLGLHPRSPDSGVPASELVAGPPPPPPAAMALANPVLPDSLPPGSPGVWHRDVAVRIEDGAPAIVQEPAVGREIPGATDVDVAAVLSDPDDIARPSWFPETALTLFALIRTGPAPLRLARLYAGNQPWASRPSSTQQADLLAILFPGLRVTAAFDGALRERAAIQLSGAARDAATATMIGGILPLARRHLPEARARVFTALGLPGNERPKREPGRRRQALYMRAAATATLANGARDLLFGLLQHHGFDISVADMEAMPWRDQVCIAAGADLLFGVHDRAMAAVVWAHPEARVLELFPPGVRRYDIQVLAEAAGIGYLGVEAAGSDGFVTRSRERFGPPTQQTGGIVADLPWDLLNEAFAPAPVP